MSFWKTIVEANTVCPLVGVAVVIVPLVIVVWILFMIGWIR